MDSPTAHDALARTLTALTLDTDALIAAHPHLEGLQRLSASAAHASSSLRASQAPAPPLSPFSSAPSELLVSSFGCLKVQAAAAGCSSPSAQATDGATQQRESVEGSGSAAAPAAAVAAGSAGLNSVQQQRCLDKTRSEQLAACFGALASECPAAPASAGPDACAALLSQASAALGPLSGNCPAHGVKAVCGKRNKMEDAFAVQPNFFDIPFSPTNDDDGDKLPSRIALQLEQEGAGSPTSSVLTASPSVAGAPLSSSGAADSSADPSTACCSCSSSEGGMGDTLHFFGVYDGHGGCQAAEHCAKRLHHHLSEALANVCSCLIADSSAQEGECQAEWPSMPSAEARAVQLQGCSGPATVSPCSPLESADYHDLFTKHPAFGTECSPAVDSGHGHEQDGDSGVGGGSSAGDNHSDAPSTSEPSASLSSMLEEALKEAFVRTDAEFASDGCAAMVGSTALVALVGSKKIWLANCGDSRAVLCRKGKAIQLTDDHKPEREDEAERVEKAGGQVLYWNGHRVMGVLAMSRAIGDHGLRPYIIPEPEVSVVNRTDDDEFLLLASDGLWDVMANQEAANLAARCFKRARDKGASRSAAVRIAAAVLTKAAIDRGSKDNVTVVIVDVGRSNEGPAGGSATVGATAAASASAGGAEDTGVSPKSCSPRASRQRSPRLPTATECDQEGSDEPVPEPPAPPAAAACACQQTACA